MAQTPPKSDKSPKSGRPNAERPNAERPNAEREDRLARKLRENLSRRKSQKRGRHSDDAGESDSLRENDPKAT